MTDLNNLCPICGEGSLTTQVGENAVDYKGHRTDLELHFSVCDACGSEQSNAVQLRTNKRAMVAFKKHVDGLLTGTEVRAIRERLGINQAEAARIFGGGPVAFSKYEHDDVAQSEAMDKLLRLAVELPAAFARLDKRANAVGEGWQVAATDRSRTSVVEPPATRSRPRVVFSSALMDEKQWLFADEQRRAA